MFKFIKMYVRWVDSFNHKLGRMVMYMVFLLMGVLLYSSLSKAFLIPSLWTLETAQFIMVAYYMLGGGYSLQKGAHVRMDILYANLSVKKKSWMDCLTSLFLFIYLLILLYGGIESTLYALEYGETSYSSWQPYMAPIKIVMCISIFFILLQSLSEFFKDLAIIKGIEL